MPYADPKKDAQCKHEWYMKHRQEKAAYDRAYRMKNREKIRLYNQSYYNEFFRKPNDGDTA